MQRGRKEIGECRSQMTAYAWITLGHGHVVDPAIIWLRAWARYFSISSASFYRSSSDDVQSLFDPASKPMTSLIRPSIISFVWGNCLDRSPVVSSIYRLLFTSTIMEETLLSLPRCIAARRSRQRVCQWLPLFHLHHRMTVLRLSTHLECGTDLIRYKYLVYRWIDPIRREEALKGMSGNL